MKSYHLCIVFFFIINGKVYTKIRTNPTSNKTKFCQGKCYTKEVLMTISHNPNELAVSKSTNTLYFSYDSGSGEYTAASLNLDKRKLKVIRGVRDAYAIACDDANGFVYFGGANGLYRYKPDAQNLRKLAVPNLDIWWVAVYNNTPCFIRFPSLRSYCYTNKGTKKLIPLEELEDKPVHQFIFNNDKDIYYINNGGLYYVGENMDHVPIFSDNPRILCLAMNGHGVIYVCSDEGIFELTDTITDSKLKKVVAIPGVLGITFDRENNLIYTDSNSIVRLQQVNENNYMDYKYLTTFNVI